MLRGTTHTSVVLMSLFECMSFCLSLKKTNVVANMFCNMYALYLYARATNHISFIVLVVVVYTRKPINMSNVKIHALRKNKIDRF